MGDVSISKSSSETDLLENIYSWNFRSSIVVKETLVSPLCLHTSNMWPNTYQLIKIYLSSFSVTTDMFVFPLYFYQFLPFLPIRFFNYNSFHANEVALDYKFKTMVLEWVYLWIWHIQMTAMVEGPTRNQVVGQFL